MKILVTGAKGLVGSHFVENYPPNSKEVTVLSPSAEEVDITDYQTVKNYFETNKPDAIIHFAAFTDVAEAEKQRNNKKGLCWVVNVRGTANLVKVSNYQPYFIFISTDVVFSGHKDNPGPYGEESPAENNKHLSWYGWTKKEAERIVQNNLKNAAILRIANPVRAKYKEKLDYVRKILNLFDTGKLYPMFDDQFLTLTFIDEITGCLKVLLDKKLAGIFHVSSINLFTPFKLADFLIDKARAVPGAVRPISIEGFLKENPSRYPQYGGLKVEKTQQELGLKFNKWEDTIIAIVKQLST